MMICGVYVRSKVEFVWKFKFRCVRCKWYFFVSLCMNDIYTGVVIITLHLFFWFFHNVHTHICTRTRIPLYYWSIFIFFFFLQHHKTIFINHIQWTRKLIMCIYIYLCLYYAVRMWNWKCEFTTFDNLYWCSKWKCNVCSI